MAYARDDDRRRDRNARPRARLQRRDVDHAMGSSMRDDENDRRWDRAGRREDPDEFPGEPRHSVDPGRDYGGFSGYGGRGYGAGRDRDYGYGIYGGESGRAGGEDDYPRRRRRRFTDRDVDQRDADRAAMIGDCLHESHQGRYGGVAPYSKHANERTYWPGYDEDHGPHRGKGPKGYTRSDERITEHVCDVLMEDPHVDASEIEVQVKNGEATLTGTVDHRSTKRRVEDLVEEISGIKAVQNNLRIKQPSSRGHP